MADRPEAAPWTIKGMPVATRQQVIRAANADNQTVAQFLVEAVNLLIDKRAGNLVMPPQDTPEIAALTADQLTQRMIAVAALQQSTAALKQATGRATGKTTLLRCLASLEQRLYDAEGRPPPRLSAKANGHIALNQTDVAAEA